MCGIVGIASRAEKVRLDFLESMRDAMSHRGPDDAGVWQSSDGRVGLGHRRLAIIDLSPGGHQPMSDIAGQLWITYNGEIYNYQELRRELEAGGHRFRTASDTEVILEAYRAWNTDCLSHLHGMFAFALYDGVARRLFLARDRAGEKPLFYHYTPGRLLFASELKALMADPSFPRVLDLEALDFYLAYGYVPGDRCILRGVHKLAQGHAMAYDLETDTLRIWHYWKLPESSWQGGESVGELADELENLLEDSVRRQLVADVPVGILLSGGVDSSLVTAMAARVSSWPVKTFTVSFPDSDLYDEAPYARLVARHFGTDHTEVAAGPASVEVLPELARQYDEPIADSSMVPTYLLSKVIREHVTVALGGDGGDELFGGYPHYSWVQRQDRTRQFIPCLVRQCMGAVATHVLPVGVRGRNYMIGFTGGLAHSIAHVNMYFDLRTRRRLLGAVELNCADTQRSPESYKTALCVPGRSPLQQATRVDFQTTMVDAYLVKVDRASMLTSLEVRMPWLDHRIVELAFGCVPDTLRANENERKILPRLLAKRLLPPGLDLNRKHGLSMPLAAWFEGEWGAYIEAALRESDSDLFDRRVIEELIQGQRRGYANTERLFALAMFELWRREYRVTIPA